MDLGLTDKSAVVLASTSGLGLAVAEALLDEGARVAISGRNPDRLQKVLERLAKSHGERVWGQAIDVTQQDALSGHLESAARRWSGVDILVVNNGGPPPSAAATLDERSLDAAYDLLVRSAVRAISIVLPGMRARNWGRILALTSMSVREPIANLVLSNMMRAGLTGYLKTLADEVAIDGVLVNSICTGLFQTDRLLELAESRAAAAGKSPEAVLKGMTERIPLKRAGDPREFGALAAFLVSTKASFLTGAAIPLDGGAGRSLL